MFGRIVVAIVWLYNGLWCKLLARCQSHAAVVSSLPGPLGSTALLLPGLGLAEVALAIWVLTGRQPTAAAAAQTTLLVGMNAGALFWTRSALPDPGGMLVQNLAFLTLVWTVAQKQRTNPSAS